MGLILCGDFQTEEVLPILEKTFSRIRPGKAPKQEPVSLPPFKGREKMKVKFPIPVVKAMGLGFRGVPANHADQVALNIAVNLLNNANGTGYLDRLMTEHKLMGAVAINESLNEAGILAVAVMPKLFIQSYHGAEKLVWREINRVKQGDFSDEVFSSLNTCDDSDEPLLAGKKLVGLSGGGRPYRVDYEGGCDARRPNLFQ